MIAYNYQQKLLKNVMNRIVKLFYLLNGNYKLIIYISYIFIVEVNINEV